MAKFFYFYFSNSKIYLCANFFFFLVRTLEPVRLMAPRDFSHHICTRTRLYCIMFFEYTPSHDAQIHIKLSCSARSLTERIACRNSCFDVVYTCYNAVQNPSEMFFFSSSCMGFALGNEGGERKLARKSRSINGSQ